MENMIEEMKIAWPPTSLRVVFCCSDSFFSSWTFFLLMLFILVSALLCGLFPPVLCLNSFLFYSETPILSCFSSLQFPLLWLPTPVLIVFRSIIPPPVLSVLPQCFCQKVSMCWSVLNKITSQFREVFFFFSFFLHLRFLCSLSVQ